MGHLYFVRHGQTIWNVENKICGATDIALTELGHQQAIETGKKILEEGIHVDEILYSPLVRAKDTAMHISEITGIPARVEPRLKEQNLGEPRYSLSADMKEENRCSALLRGFIICWMNSRRNPEKKRICWWRIMELPV